MSWLYLSWSTMDVIWKACSGSMISREAATSGQLSLIHRGISDVMDVSNNLEMSEVEQLALTVDVGGVKERCTWDIAAHKARGSCMPGTSARMFSYVFISSCCCLSIWGCAANFVGTAHQISSSAVRYDIFLLGHSLLLAIRNGISS